MSDERDDLPRDLGLGHRSFDDGSSDDVHADAAAYALDALEPAERAAFEEHLATCDRCRREVADLQEAASSLVLAEAVPPPPPGLRAAVLDGVRGVEQLPAEPAEPGEPGEVRPRRALVEPGDEVRPVTPLRAVPAATGSPASSSSPASDPVVDELALRRAGRRARLASVLVAAVTVVALALGFTVWGLVRREPTVAGPGPTVTATVPQVDPSLLAAPDVRIYRTTVNGATASFVVSKSQDRAVFVSADLPAPPAGDVYHLWTLRGSTVRPDATFTASGAAAQELSGPVDESTQLAINVERAGSDPQTPTPPVLGIVTL